VKKGQYRFNKKEKQILYLILNAAMIEEYGDRRPEQVVENDYNGDEDAYLNVMLKWHNIDRNYLRKIAKHWPG